MQTWVGVLLPQLEQFVPRSRQAEPAPNPAQSASTLQSAQAAGPDPQKSALVVVV